MKFLLIGVGIAVAAGLIVIGATKKKTASLTWDAYLAELKEIAERCAREKNMTGEARTFGSKCTISRENDKIIAVIEIYSKAENKQWVRTTARNERSISDFIAEKETQKKLRELKENEMKFDM